MFQTGLPHHERVIPNHLRYSTYLSGVEPVVSVVSTGRRLQSTDDRFGDGFSDSRLVVSFLEIQKLLSKKTNQR